MSFTVAESTPQKISPPLSEVARGLDGTSERKAPLSEIASHPSTSREQPPALEGNQLSPLNPFP